MANVQREGRSCILKVADGYWQAASQQAQYQNQRDR
jgi:hypothetical protein